MLAYTYMEHGRFSLIEKPVPELKDPKDALVRVTLGSICTSDLHIKHGSVRVLYRVLRWGMKWWASWKRSVQKSLP